MPCITIFEHFFFGSKRGLRPAGFVCAQAEEADEAAAAAGAEEIRRWPVWGRFILGTLLQKAAFWKPWRLVYGDCFRDYAFLVWV